jgi:molecular chaperone GrpE (heat shock protein)
LLELPIAFQDARNQLTDLQAIRKEYHKVRTDLEGVAAQTSASLKTLTDTLAQGLASLDARQKAFDQAALDLQKAERDKMDLRQAKGDADRRTEAWQKAAFQFVQVLERTADPETGLAEGYLKAAGKLAGDFGRTFGPLGLQLIRPAAGDRFDERIHEFAAEVETAALDPGTVASCAQWGFLLGEVVTAKARVVLARAPKPQPQTAPDAPPAAPPSDFPSDQAKASPLAATS